MAATRRVINPRKLRPYTQPPRVRRPLIPNGADAAATGFLAAGVIWMAVASGIGALWGLLRLVPDFVALGIEIPVPLLDFAITVEVTAATATDGFWNALVYGWLGNALIGAALFAAPRLTGRRLANEWLSVLAVVFWNLGVLGGITALYAPQFNAAGFLFEFPFVMDGPLALALLLATVSFALTVIGPPWRVPYVGLAFAGVGLLMLLGAVNVAAAVDTAVIFLGLEATWAGLLYGVAGRMLLLLGIGGLTIGALLYAVPRVTGNKLWSSGMAWLAWLLWVALGSLALLGALVDPAIPVFVTRAGDAAMIMLLAPLLLLVADLLLTVSGRWVLVISPGALAFAVIATLFLGAAGLLDAIGAMVAGPGPLRSGDWGFGVLLWSLAGAGGVATLAVFDHALPRLLRRDWGDTMLVDVTLYAVFIGITLAGFVLMIGGVVESGLVARGRPPEEVELTLRWFHAVSAAGLGLAALGGLASLLNVFLMYTSGRPASYTVPADVAPAVGQG